MSFLPADLLMDILSRLPVKPLMRFRCVSNFWNTLVNDPDFIKLHLNQSIINGTNNHNHLVFKPDSKLFQLQYPFDFESPNVPKQVDIDQYSLPLVSELVATCNGLLCLSTHHNSIIILNPSTRKYKVSVEEPVQYPGHAVSRHPIFGFGYDSVNDEYKVVRIVYFQFYALFEDFPDFPFRSEVQVYRVSTNSWKKVSSIPCDIRDRSRSSSGVLVNGALHWMGARDTRTASDISHDLIISFGIRDEEFREVPQPDDDFGDVMDKKILMIKNGCLCMIRFTPRNRDFGYEVWVMKDYGIKESWTKEYVIEETKLIGVATKYFKPIVFLKNGEQILIEGTNGKLIVYDLKKEQIKDFTIVGVTDWIEKMTYVESLVPMHSQQPPAFVVPVNVKQGMPPTFSYPPFPAEGAQPFFNGHYETAQTDLASEGGSEQTSLLGFPPHPPGSMSFPDNYPRPWNVGHAAGAPFEQMQVSQAVLEGYTNAVDSQGRVQFFQQGDYGRMSEGLPSTPPPPLGSKGLEPHQSGSASDHKDGKGVLAPLPLPPPPPPPPPPPLPHLSQLQRGNFSNSGDTGREG